MSFEPDPTLLLRFFALVSPRRSESRVLCSNKEGHAVIYDAVANSIEPVPNVIGHMGFRPITVSIARAGAIEEDLYVMSSIPDMGPNSCCFDVLRCATLNNDDRESLGSESRYKWQWPPLPGPPFSSLIVSHAVLDGGRTLCVSAIRDKDSYCFDTVERKWRVAYNWALPFEGGAEYIPDLKLWLGFSPGSYLPCVSDLSSMDQQPTLKDTWIDLIIPENWETMAFNLINLGQHRFCIAKVFQIGQIPDKMVVRFAVLAGAEMVNDPKDGVLMVKHKAIRYMFVKDRIEWFL